MLAQRDSDDVRSEGGFNFRPMVSGTVSFMTGARLVGVDLVNKEMNE